MKMVNLHESVTFRMTLAVSVVLLCLTGLLKSAFAASAEEVYASLAKIPKEQRQKTILERAQKEGKVVVYGATTKRQGPVGT
jgi:hypothetical protein